MKYKKYFDYVNIELVAITQPLKINPDTGKLLTPQEFIAYTARVSNPSNQMNTLTADKLLNYCIQKKHWSIFQMVSMCFEVNTTRDIGRQILRHHFDFQEYSARYADPTQDLDFVVREARLQDTKNRQNSIEIDEDNPIVADWYNMQIEAIDDATKRYKKALEMGVAKENARSVLPEGNTCTRMYMSGHLRSFIHYCEVREDKSTQKEHRVIAEKIKTELRKHFSFLA